MIKKILVGLGIILAIFVVIAAFKPEDYLIKRSIMIKASADVIYPYLVSMKKADTWMPWNDLDPNVKTTYLGPEEGNGAISSWVSTGDMGTGQAEIVEVVPNQLVKTKITYTKPMEMSQDSEFILEPQGESTQMTWSVTGKQPFIARLMCTMLFMNMDKYVGGMFEQGLNKLKLIVEQGSEK